MTAREHLRKLRWVRRKAIESWVAGNRVRLFTEGDAAFEQMLAAIGAAERRVWLEMYWFAADRVGLRFFRALEAAVRRGVQVAVLYDAWGSFGTPRQHFEQLRAAGASVLDFNPVSPMEQRFRLAGLTQRNHRKLLLIDGRTAFTGGQNIADEWTATLGNGWKDEVVEVSGPVVYNLEQAFVDSWRHAHAEAAGSVAAPVLTPTVLANAEVVSGVNVAVLTQAGLRQRRYALRAYLQRLRAASDSINIANAYFLPNPALVRSLVAAARRGVRVRVIVAGRSDVPFVTLASRAVWSKLLRAGVQLFAWHRSVLHSKLAVVDANWVTVGSFNLDYVSLRRNRELNLAVADAGFADTVNQEFEAMLAVSEEVTQAAFARRPLLLRVLERLVYAFRTWL